MSFLEEHLDCSLEEHVDEVLYGKLREIVMTYEERLREASERISSRQYMTKGDCKIGTCPNCSNETVLKRVYSVFSVTNRLEWLNAFVVANSFLLTILTKWITVQYV